jgi:hypothetical protein
LTLIQTYRPQALSLVEFFDQPMKAMVHSAFHTPSFIIPHPKVPQREITERKNQSEHKNKHMQ